MRTSGQRKALSATHLRGSSEVPMSNPNRDGTPLGERIRYFIQVMFLLPIPLFLLIVLAILLIKPTADSFEDIDVWCEQYHPDLTYSECLDEAGV